MVGVCMVVVIQPHNRYMEATQPNRPYQPLTNNFDLHTQTIHHISSLPHSHHRTNLCKHSFPHNMLVIMLIRGWSTVCNESSSCRKVFYILSIQRKCGKFSYAYTNIYLTCAHVCVMYDHSMLILSWKYTDTYVCECVCFFQVKVISEMPETV